MSLIIMISNICRKRRPHHRAAQAAAVRAYAMKAITRPRYVGGSEDQELRTMTGLLLGCPLSTLTDAFHPFLLLSLELCPLTPLLSFIFFWAAEIVLTNDGTSLTFGLKVHSFISLSRTSCAAQSHGACQNHGGTRGKVHARAKQCTFKHSPAQVVLVHRAINTFACVHAHTHAYICECTRRRRR